MVNAILGLKQEQTRKYTTAGTRVPVTFIKADPSVVVQIKSQETDGYSALQFGWGTRKDKNIKKPVLGHFKKAGIEKSPRFLREIRLENSEELANFKIGDQVRLEDVLKPGDVVNVTGISKGKGFAGGVKRWGFRGGPRTHGQSDRERAPGSSGSTTTPGRVLKGKKMAGRMGQDQITVRNLLVVAIDSEKNLVLVKGLVPGNTGGLLVIKKVGEAKKFAEVELYAKKEEAQVEELQPAEEIPTVEEPESEETPAEEATEASSEAVSEESQEQSAEAEVPAEAIEAEEEVKA